MYKKKYNLKEVSKAVEQLISDGNKFVDLQTLLFEIGFEPHDVNIFYTENIKHRLRYDYNYRR